ncbi:endonuclease/exonuclease/phosphatase family protein [Stackebrandtia nassauensis]|uniref:Endonuclease/exonuclease/phosphatase n=1 Tax=Stackebrandtia nassauensis (strain DSM 44728 / CIP 108903 / NRRL B-16338 / NBRC 102104 / LLR-40K-21) TaxID=446470 RepID=D3PZ37_STANL|nr:endonuclease/exonuclease/phosphatase family protein [Stackebrandtia nassauensis]ADD45466.1 Endonuclease/exonuclease/phosphatase [Stackebrandtia nassauensis DSM 44728]
MRPPVRRALIAAIGAGAIAIPVTIAGVAVAAQATTIAEIQGAAHVSPVAGEEVTDIPGTVTAVSEKGFWMQSAEPDSDEATSDGIYVFTNAAPEAKVGDAVKVAGKVTEYRPGKAENNLSTTEITEPKVSVEGSGGEAPEATLVGPDGRVAPEKVHSAEPGDVEKADFDVKANALDFYESMEGMLVRVKDSVAVGPTTKNGEVSVLPGGEGGLRTERGGVKFTGEDANTERVVLDDLVSEAPVANVGDKLPDDVDGVLDYSFGNFKLNALETPKVESAGLKPETTEAQGDKLAMATYNVENLDPKDDQAAFDRHGEYIAKNLASPDILGIEEIQDNNGADDDGTVAADETWKKLIEAIKAAGGPSYEYQSIDPENNADGGEPGGNIRTGFLYNPERVKPSGKDAGDATTPVEVSAEGLSVSPGRVAPADDAWKDSRKPVAAEFEFNGKKVFAVVNHFASKGGDDPLMGRFQPPARSSEEQRHPQAELVNKFVKELQGAVPDANVVVLGDINDFEFSETVAKLTAGDALKGAYDLLDEKERYSYVFDGNSQVLDQILVSPKLAEAAELDVVHVNSEFTDQASDHDPSVVKLTL